MKEIVCEKFLHHILLITQTDNEFMESEFRIGFGFRWLSSLILVPSPPANITTFISVLHCISGTLYSSRILFRLYSFLPAFHPAHILSCLHSILSALFPACIPSCLYSFLLTFHPARILLPEHIQLVLFQYPERVLYLIQSFAVFKLCLQFFSPVL